jgi:hypothetical protein
MSGTSLIVDFVAVDGEPAEPVVMDPAFYKAHLRKLNRRSANPYPVCMACRTPYDRSQRHWLFARRCDSCGLLKMERLVRQIVNARSGETLTRAISALQRGPYEAECTEESKLRRAQWAAVRRLRKADPALAQKCEIELRAAIEAARKKKVSWHWFT